MEDKDIQIRTRHLKDENDLLDLLNELKKEEYGEETPLFTMKQLMFYCNPNHGRRYKKFQIPKKKKGEFRTISAPRGALKKLQHFVNVMLGALYVPGKSVTGFVKNRSVIDNAKIHVGMNYVLNIDLEDFFTSIPQVRIWYILQKHPYYIKPKVASIIAGLCAISLPKTDNPKDIKKDFDYVLPQGSPTSPILSNISCEHLDRKLEGLAKKYKINYSRYADDISFSSMHYVYSREGNFWKELKQIIEHHHLKINENKTRLLAKGHRQEVTGLTVNTKVNVTKKYVMELRRILNTWEKYGYATAFKNFYPRYKSEKGHVKLGEPNLANIISGKLLYLKMVKGDDDPVYMKLSSRYSALIDDDSKTTTEINGVRYSATQTIKSFENTYKTKIEKDENEEGKYFFMFKEDTNHIIRKNVSISHNAKGLPFETLYISLCQNKSQNYYLIHKKLKSEDSLISKKLELDALLDSFVENFDFDVLDVQKKNKLTYKNTMKISDFESMYSCKVYIADNKKSASCKISEKNVTILISKNISFEGNSPHLISLCSNGIDEPFWLIHNNKLNLH